MTIVQVYLYLEYVCVQELTFTNPYLSTQLLDSLQHIHSFNWICKPCLQCCLEIGRILMWYFCNTMKNATLYLLRP